MIGELLHESALHLGYVIPSTRHVDRPLQRDEAYRTLGVCSSPDTEAKFRRLAFRDRFVDRLSGLRALDCETPIDEQVKVLIVYKASDMAEHVNLRWARFVVVLDFFGHPVLVGHVTRDSAVRPFLDPKLAMHLSEHDALGKGVVDGSSVPKLEAEVLAFINGEVFGDFEPRVDAIEAETASGWSLGGVVARRGLLRI